MHKPVSLFTLTAAIIVAAWWWLVRRCRCRHRRVAFGEKLYCVSYAPCPRRPESARSFDQIEPAQIEQDLAQLAKVTDCVRTYSVDFGLDHVPEIAQRYGLKVLLGLWVRVIPTARSIKISTALRWRTGFRTWSVRSSSATRCYCAGGITGDAGRDHPWREVAVKMQVTYADVWEFWLRYRELENVVDLSRSISCRIGKTIRSRRGLPRIMSIRFVSMW